ncbi:uncharacterized protein PHACADRAFT_214018 [Phanerochaete carnosa HHB-10118-sp]|uniref:Glycoside hydrolase family 16 protein n=1 Tax=Phanerochaete carnosa (strain HHB-10118-sp) TaxID=650164 RepID=K5VGK5_PHACS|nr:uncharacterized protein PHACADRAFT_214018 [Phanerochaete carnosa HHB-10118-sp]EKM50318.1 hypothetical protein PHACADRAFT_214018 [Phanerochaete carnosa HHB-10118-sp]
MFSFKNLLSALSLVALVHALPAKPIQRRTGFGSMCSTTQFNLSNSVPADFNFTQPNTTFPTFVALSVGTQNYTCGDDGTWSPIGAITELYDISCIPQEEHANFTTMIADMWENSPNTWTSEDIVLSTEAANGPTALGMHYWISDPNNATSGKIFAKWDFGMSRMMEVTDMNTAFVVCSETDVVPDPINPVLNSAWLYEPVLYVDGQKDGQLADQVYRFNSNGGSAPNTTCRANFDFLQVKSTLNFWFYGGAWVNTTSSS